MEHLAVILCIMLVLVASIATIVVVVAQELDERA